MKDNRAFILREDKAEEFLNKPKNKPTITIEEVSKSITELEEENAKMKEENHSYFVRGLVAGLLTGGFLGEMVMYILYVYVVVNGGIR